MRGENTLYETRRISASHERVGADLYKVQDDLKRGAMFRRQP